MSRNTEKNILFPISPKWNEKQTLKCLYRSRIQCVEQQRQMPQERRGGSKFDTHRRSWPAELLPNPAAQGVPIQARVRQVQGSSTVISVNVFTLTINNFLNFGLRLIL